MICGLRLRLLLWMVRMGGKLEMTLGSSFTGWCLSAKMIICKSLGLEYLIDSMSND
jgi:hypothetical protein